MWRTKTSEVGLVCQGYFIWNILPAFESQFFSEWNLWYLDIRCWFTLPVREGRDWSKICRAPSEILTRGRRRRWGRRWRLVLIVALRLTGLCLHGWLQLLLREGRDRPEVYRGSAVGCGWWRDISIALAFWLVSVGVSGVQQIVHTVAS